jgi:hypothetical protein
LLATLNQQLDRFSQPVHALLNSGQCHRWRFLSRANGRLVGYSLFRSRQNFSERDRLILNLLRPHVSQAHESAKCYHRLKQAFELTAQITIDSHGHVELITPRATEYLKLYFNCPANSPRLPDSLWCWVKSRVAILADETQIPTTPLPLRVEQAGKVLIVRLLGKSDSNQYTLLLEEETRSIEPQLKLLGLSIADFAGQR